MSTCLNFRTCSKTICWSTLMTSKSINNEEFNQPGHSIHSFHGQKFIPSTTKKTFPTTRGHERTAESHKTQREKACDLLLFLRHVAAKIIRKHTCGLNESKDLYLRSITYIHTHIPMYVSKDKIFILLTLANYGTIYLIDFINM